jgi:hypothetical protein
MLALFFGLLFSYFPFLYSLSSGQLGGLLFFAVALVFRGFNRNNPILSGFGIFLMLLKPHLFYLLFLLILFRAARTRNFTALFFAGVYCAIFASAFSLLHSTALSDWLATFRAPKSDLYVPVYSWEVPTLVGMVRILLSGPSGQMPVYPVFLIPLVTAVFFAFSLIRRRTEFHWTDALPATLLLSYLTSPYGWISDQTILLPAYFATVAQGFLSSAKNFSRAIASGLALQVLAFLGIEFVFSEEHQLVWLPIGMTLLHYLFVADRAEKE